MAQFTLPHISEALMTQEKVKKAYDKLCTLIEAIESRPIPEDLKENIQACLIIIDVSPQKNKEVLKAIKKGKNTILKLLEKHLKLVPRNYYFVVWMSIGLAAFGIPIGIAIGTALGNIAFLGIGFPFGMLIGMAVGKAMDRKAATEGRQLPIDL